MRAVELQNRKQQDGQCIMVQCLRNIYTFVAVLRARYHFIWRGHFYGDISTQYQIDGNRPVGGALVHADRRMDVTERIDTFCNGANIPKNWITKDMEPDTVDRLHVSDEVLHSLFTCQFWYGCSIKKWTVIVKPLKCINSETFVYKPETCTSESMKICYMRTLWREVNMAELKKSNFGYGKTLYPGNFCLRSTGFGYIQPLL
jgi:hypothetical protein